MSAELWKGAIAAEMVGLYAASTLVNEKPTYDSSVWLTILDKRGLKRMLAVVLLMAGLLTAADFGYGGPAAAFGGLVVLGYLVSAAGPFSQGLRDFTGWVSA